MTTIALKLNSQLTIRKYAEKSERNEMDRACGTYDRRSADEVLVGRVEGKRSLGGPRRRWEDNIKTDRQ